MAPELVIKGASLVLQGAYKAFSEVKAGDALRFLGNWYVGPTVGSTDDVIGYAEHSAPANQDVGVIIAGLARTVPVVPVTFGQPVTPCPDIPGRAHRASDALGLVVQSARKHGVAVESKAIGKPVWVHLRHFGQ